MCKQGGELIACSFCTAVYHNSGARLGELKLSDELAASACFPWACPACFKKGVASVQRTVLLLLRPGAALQLRLLLLVLQLLLHLLQLLVLHWRQWQLL